MKEERDRKCPGTRIMLITTDQARSFFRRGNNVKAVIETNEGLVSIKIIVDESEFYIAEKDFNDKKTWLTRDKAIIHICRNFGLPEATNIEIEFKKK
jgi:hypothetical protein